MKPHQFLRWYEALLVQLLVRSPRVEGIMIRSADMPVAWVVRKQPLGDIAREHLERSYRS